jgi:hypothetical protein
MSEVKKFYNTHESFVLLNEVVDSGCKKNIEKIFDIINYQETAELARTKFMNILKVLNKQGLVSFAEGDNRKWNDDDSFNINDVRRKTISEESGLYFKDKFADKKNFTLEFNKKEINKHFKRDVVSDIKNLMHKYFAQFNEVELREDREKLAKNMAEEIEDL